MKEIDNKGFGKIELITMLGLIAVLLAIGAKLAADSGSNYRNFKTLSVNFAKNVSMYKDMYTKNDNVYYLYELIEKGYSEELTNPMDSSQKCDIYESYVDATQTNNKKVNLLCGSYLVVGTQNDGYEVYKISEWSETKNGNSNDSDVLYNYTKDEKLMLTEYLTFHHFLNKYFENEESVITNPFDVNSKEGQKLLMKNVYREKTLVKELK